MIALFLLSKNKIISYAVTLLAEDNQTLSKVKDLKYQCIGMYVKQKLRIKIRLNNIDIFLNQTLFELIHAVNKNLMLIIARIIFQC